MTETKMYITAILMFVLMMTEVYAQWMPTSGPISSTISSIVKHN